MGCASSSPLINGGGPGGIVETAKETATKTANDVLHAGESAIHDVGEHVKGAVQNVANEIEGVLGGKKSTKEDSDHINENDHPQINGSDGSDYKIIPLKDKQGSLDENMENIKNNLLTKAQSFGDEADQMADDIMKETEDLIRDAETGIADCANEMTTRITSSEDGTIEILNLEEPEIERILDNDPKCPPTPEATMNSLLSSSDGDGGATESETVDSAATVIEKASEAKREATESTGNSSNSVASSSSQKKDNDGNDAVRQLEGAGGDGAAAGTSLEAQPTDAEDTQLTQSNLDNAEGEFFFEDYDDDDDGLTPGERRRRNRIHHFKFKLNSAELSIIEEKTDEDSNRQTPEESFLRSKAEDAASLRLEDRKDPEGQADSVDSEGNKVDVESEGVAAAAAARVDEIDEVEENSSEKSLKGFEDVERLLEKMPSTARLNRMLTRFYSFDQPRDRDEDDSGGEENDEFPRKKISLREFKAKMSSMTALDGFDESGSEEEGSGEGEGDEPDEADDGEGDDVDVDAAIDEILAESISTGEEIEEKKDEKQ